MARGILLALMPLVIVTATVWIEKTGLWPFPASFSPILLAATYLIGAAGIAQLPLARTPKCLLGAGYTVAIVPGMLFLGLLTSCALGDCI